MVICRRRMNFPSQNLVWILRLIMSYTYQEFMKSFIIHIKRLSGNSRRAHKQVRKWLLSPLEDQERRLAGVSYVVREWRWDKDLHVQAGAWVVWTSHQGQRREYPSFLIRLPTCRACGAEGEDKAVRLTSYQQSNIKKWSQTLACILKNFLL